MGRKAFCLFLHELHVGGSHSLQVEDPLSRNYTFLSFIITIAYKTEVFKVRRLHFRHNHKDYTACLLKDIPMFSTLVL